MIRKGGNRLFVIVAGLAGGIFVLPILLGLWQTILPAFGHLPAIGAVGPDLAAWQRLAALPGLATSLRLTVTTGLAATVISLMLAIGFHLAIRQGRAGIILTRSLAPLLAAPHAAIAIGLAFLIAPSGWLFRLLSPWATGQATPPDLAIVNDPLGLSLILGLALKETPFLILVIGAALNQFPAHDHLAAARSLGYGRRMAWLKIILPQVYGQIRLAIYAVLAFSLSVVDMAIILGPGNPPTLAVQTLRWFSAPDITLVMPAAAAAMTQVAIIIAGIALWWMLERVVIAIGRLWIDRGARHTLAEQMLNVLTKTSVALLGVGLLALISLLLWSVTWRWNFPDALPQTWSLRIWRQAASNWWPALQTTLIIGLGSGLFALVIAIAWLEAEDRARRQQARLLTWLVYAPLLLPQTAFLFGLHIALLRLGLDGSLPTVIWVHTLFVFPYVMLALADPWRRLDNRYTRTAASLGKGPMSILMRIKLPILLRPLLAAFAIGFAVSVAQYLPTLVIGAGRIETLTTEAVALSSGGDRRVIGVFATLQSLLPMVFYAMALAAPGLLYAHRRALAGESR